MCCMFHTWVIVFLLVALLSCLKKFLGFSQEMVSERQLFQDCTSKSIVISKKKKSIFISSFYWIQFEQKKSNLNINISMFNIFAPWLFGFQIFSEKSNVLLYHNAFWVLKALLYVRCLKFHDGTPYCRTILSFIVLVHSESF